MGKNVLKLMGLTKRVCKVVGVVGIMVVVGWAVLNAQEQTGIPQVRTNEAVRADAPPVLDGKLDEVCWQKAKGITDFFSWDSDRRATYQSIGYICYDDAHLYIGMKCLMPEGVAPGVEQGTSKDKKPHDTYVFSDDIVEIMIDPGHSQTDYYQLVVSAYGSTFDTYRRSGGTQHDPSWNGDWSSGSYIGEGFWSMEMAVPFHNRGISPEVGSTWGINLCRETKKPLVEYSSIAVSGAFNNTKSFAVLKGLNVDFSKYFFQIGPAVTRLESGDEQSGALFTVPVKNMTGKTMKTKIDRWYAGTDGKDAVESQTVTLGSGGTIALSAEPLAVEPLSGGRSDAYIIKGIPDMKKIVVSDAVDGTILAVSLVNRPWFCEAMKIEVEDPWQKDMTSEKSQSVSLKVCTLLSEEQLKSGELTVTLTSRETGKTLTTNPAKDAPPLMHDWNYTSEITKITFHATD
ncbi:MAG: hypothetical protein HYY56_00490, partial [Candidatus Omnitrophica bacterium]|nr:hypothetical protein [Candidatus Omnitrophota bacterium]